MSDEKNSFLLKYLSLALAVQQGSEGWAQVFYTDFSPDLLLTPNVQSPEWQFDGDGDGYSDWVFSFVPWHYNAYDSHYGSFCNLAYIWAIGSNSSGQQTVGEVSRVVFGQTIGPGFMPPSPNSSFIRSVHYFQTGSNGINLNQVMEFGPALLDMDEFYGFAIPTGGGQDRYGWMRLRYNSSPRHVIVKDMAMELTPGVPIMAGQVASNNGNNLYSQGLRAQSEDDDSGPGSNLRSDVLNDSTTYSLLRHLDEEDESHIIHFGNILKLTAVEGECNCRMRVYNQNQELLHEEIIVDVANWYLDLQKFPKGLIVVHLQIGLDNWIYKFLH